MKSSTRTKKKVSSTVAESAVEYLESFRQMLGGRDEASIAISIRVPQNILKSYKARAAVENRPYQSMMIQALRRYLEEQDK